MSVSADDIRRWILQATALPDGKASEVVVEEVQRNVWSCIFKARMPSIPYPVAVKLIIDEQNQHPVADEAAQDFAALRKVWIASEKGRKFRALRPDPLLLERACLVTNWVSGQTMSKRWAGWGKTPVEMANDAAAAGRWLRNFHDSGCAGHGILDTRAMLAKLSDLAATAAAGFRQRPLVRNAFALLAESADKAACREFQSGWLHGDFKSGNILFDMEPRPIGIDIQLTAENDIGLHDVTNFLVDLDLLALEPRSLRLPRERMSVAKAFTAGYFGAAEQSPSLTLLWMQLHLTLTIWAGRENAPKRDLRSRFLRIRLRMIAKRLVAELAKKTDDAVARGHRDPRRSGRDQPRSGANSAAGGLGR